MNGSAQSVAAALRERQSFVLTSHARPDGDAIGSAMALALALESMGKTVRVVFRDPAPPPYRVFPAVDRIQITDDAGGPADAAVLLECGHLGRPEVAGLDRYFVVNIDHHPGNAMYGAVNWFDESAAACAEMVAEVIDELGVTWTPAIASHLYLAIATDTGGFRHGPISARTFEICARISNTGVKAADMSRLIFDSYGIGRVRLMGALLNEMELHHGNRIALLSLDDTLLATSGASIDDTEGLVNLPLGAREIVAVAFFKRQTGDVFRVSLRSKGSVDVRAVAAKWQGGGHTNAAGCTVTGEIAAVKRAVAVALADAVDAGAA